MSKSLDTKAARDEQLRDLLSTLWMMKKAFSSSSSSNSKGVRDDGDEASEAAAKLLTEDLRMADAENSRASSSNEGAMAKPSMLGAADARIKQLEDEYIARVVEMCLEVQQRLRADRDEWRLMAENLQPKGEEDDDEGENGDEAEEDDDAEGDPPTATDGATYWFRISRTA